MVGKILKEHYMMSLTFIHNVRVSNLTLKWLYYSDYVFTRICSQPLKSVIHIPRKVNYKSAVPHLEHKIGI